MVGQKRMFRELASVVLNEILEIMPAGELQEQLSERVIHMIEHGYTINNDALLRLDLLSLLIDSVIELKQIKASLAKKLARGTNLYHDFRERVVQLVRSELGINEEHLFRELEQQDQHLNDNRANKNTKFSWQKLKFGNSSQALEKRWDLKL